MGLLAKRLGENAKRIREARGLSLNALARNAKLSPAYLLSIERGESWPREPKLIALGRALGVDPVVLMAAHLPEKPGVVLDIETARQLFDNLGIQLGAARASKGKKDPSEKE